MHGISKLIIILTSLLSIENLLAANASVLDDLYLEQKPKKEVKLIKTNWQELNKPLKKKMFRARKGDSYKNVIKNWLAMEGYSHTKSNLTIKDNAILKKNLQANHAQYDNFPNALENLLKQAQYQPKDTSESSFLLSLDDQNETASLLSAFNGLSVISSKEKIINVSTFEIYQGETYDTALARWTYDHGYFNYGKLLDDNAKLLLGQKNNESVTYEENFQKAVELLFSKATNQALDDDREADEGFIDDDDKENIELRLYLDTAANQAVLTSSNLPVTLFMVKKGSLKRNFLNLAKHFGWKADESHFLAKDYKISFEYPIVSEKGNVQRALSKLIIDFPELKGAIVPSSRQIYVMMER